MKITALEINQFMKVECVSMAFEPSGAITIAGDNGSGKTSVSNFIQLCFGGKDKCPPLPVKVGAKKALGKLTLDDEGHCVTIEVEIGENREVKAVVRQDGGQPFKSPITMLKALVSRFTFDPFALLQLTGQDQRKAMLDCLGVNFDDLESTAAKLRDERKEVGRDRAGRERQIATMTEYSGIPANEIQMGEVAMELQKAVVHNGRCRKYAEAVDEWELEIVKDTAGIERLELELKDARKRLDDDRAELALANMESAKLKPIDIAPIQKRLTEADEINAKVRANKTRAGLVAQYQEDHDRYKALGEQLDAIEKQKQDRLNAAKCPVKGLEFRDDGVWYQGLPLSQDMESGQMIKAVELSAALNPKLRTICIDNADRLLPAKIKELNDWAEANDYQAILFRASTEKKGCEFFLQEGKVQND